MLCLMPYFISLSFHLAGGSWTYSSVWKYVTDLMGCLAIWFGSWFCNIPFCTVVICGGMKRGFLSQKGCEGGRGVKENDLNWNKKNTSLGIGVSTDSEDIMYDDFFLGKLVEYPVVANYVRNTWGKFRLVRSMFSASIGLFSFQFSSMDGLDAMLENGSWFIRNSLLILKKWHLDENLFKEDVFGHIHEECPRSTGVGEKKTMKKPNQPSQGFKPQKEYRSVSKKPTASSNGNKKKCVEPTEVSNSNSFDVLNSFDNDVEFGKLRLLDNDGNPLVPTGIMESDSEVEVVFDETVNLRILTSRKDRSDKGYSLLEQWRDSYPDNDDYDPYDDDMYENHDLSEHPQSICDDFDITASFQVIANDSTNTQGIQEDDWTNDDLSKVKGPEKRGYVRCDQTTNSNLPDILRSMNIQIPDNYSPGQNNSTNGNLGNSDQGSSVTDQNIDSWGVKRSKLITMLATFDEVTIR
nr:hypothetical protein [Tanacetum cinerariifolium]